MTLNEVQNPLLNNEPTNIIVIGLGTTGAEFVDDIVATLKLYGQGQLRLNQAFVVMESNADTMPTLLNIKDENRIQIIHPPNYSTLQIFDQDFPNNVNIPTDGGAGCIRRTGLAFYRYNRAAIKANIIRVANEFLLQGGVPNFTVIFVASLFGGTGSSFLVELSLDVKAWLHQFNAQISTMAIGVLPRKTGSTDIVKANAMAALKEISFIRSLKEPKQIGDRVYENPFDFFFLVSTEKATGNIGSQAKAAVTKLLIDLGFIPFRELQHRKRPKGLDWADLKTYALNAVGEFSTFGLWSVSLPIKEVEWVIKTETEIAADKARFTEIEAGLDNVKASIAEEKSDLEAASTSARDIEQKVLGLSEMLAHGYRKLYDQLEGHSAAVKNCKSSITEAEGALQAVQALLPDKQLKQEKTLLDEQDKFRKSIEDGLSVKQSDDFSMRIPIAKAGLQRFREDKPVLEDQSLDQLCTMLGQAADYTTAVTTPIQHYSLLSNAKTVLNYSMTPTIQKELDATTIAILNNWGVTEIDPMTKVANLKRNKVVFTVICPSSVERNIELVDDSLTPLVTHATQVISKDSELKRIYSTIWPYSIHFYSLHLGLPLFESDTKQTPRLLDLGVFNQAYEDIKKEPMDAGDKIQRAHAFLFGDSDVALHLAHLNLANCHTAEQRNEKITEFWKNYEIIEPRTNLNQIYLSLATVISNNKNYINEIEGISKSINVQCKEDLPNKYDIISVNEVNSVCRTLLEDLEKLDGLLSSLSQTSYENVTILKSQSRAMPLLVKRISEEKKSHIKQCTDDAFRWTENCANLLTGIGSTNELVMRWLLGVQKYLARVPAARSDLSDIVKNIAANHGAIQQKSRTGIVTTQQNTKINLASLTDTIREMRKPM